MKQYQIEVKKADDIPIAKEHPIVIEKHKTDYKAILDSNDGETISIVTNKYNLVQHKDVFDTVSKIPGYKIAKAMLYRNGGRMYVDMVSELNPKLEIMKKDDFIIKARVMNSYDGSSKLLVRSSALRVVCTNGMLAPVGRKSFPVKIHKGSVDISHLTGKVEEAITQWDTIAPVLRESMEKVVPTKLATQYIGNFPKKYIDNVIAGTKKKDSIYNIWNGFTYVLSHESGVNEKVLMEHHDKVNKVFDLLKMDDRQLKELAKKYKDMVKK
jgi:hypothetical protein